MPSNRQRDQKNSSDGSVAHPRETAESFKNSLKEGWTQAKDAGEEGKFVSPLTVTFN